MDEEQMPMNMLVSSIPPCDSIGSSGIHRYPVVRHMKILWKVRECFATKGKLRLLGHAERCLVIDNLVDE